MLDIIKQFDSVIAKFLREGEKIALAVSGGMDSMCMLDIALRSSILKKNQLLVISVDHKIRGESSRNDVTFVGDFCAKEGVEFLPFERDVPKLSKEKAIGIEEAARNVRHEIFDNLISGGRAGKVLLAHHANDNVESILMHMLRGSGLKGLQGMDVLNNGKILRPLLNTPKSSIEVFVRDFSVPYVVDNTNNDTKYTRNFLRHEVLPLIRSRYKNADSAILNLSTEATKTLAAIELDANFIQAQDGIVKIKMPALESDFADRYTISALQKLDASTEFSRKNIQDIIALKNKQNGTSINLPNGYVAIKEYSVITILQTTSVVDAAFGVPQLGIPLQIDIDKLPQNAILRLRKSGDTFRPYGGGTKKLKDYLIDKKIPKRTRDKLIVLAEDGDNKNEILAIIGIEICDNLKITETTRTITKLRI